MSKESTQIKHMMRSGKAMMDFQARGKLPDAIEPTSPLITYLESIPPRERGRIVNVKLSPKLGYQSNARFANAQQMLRYLKPASWVVGHWPARSHEIRGFRARITKEIFDDSQS